MWYNRCVSLIRILISHVNDLAIGGNTFFQMMTEKLKKVFKVSTHENGSFKYLGLEVLQTSEWVKIHPDLYIPTIISISISPNCMAKKTEELTTKKKAELKHLSGQMK